VIDDGDGEVRYSSCQRPIDPPSEFSEPPNERTREEICAYVLQISPRLKARVRACGGAVRDGGNPVLSNGLGVEVQHQTDRLSQTVSVQPPTYGRDGNRAERSDKRPTIDSSMIGPVRRLNGRGPAAWSM
jgi:hypothetical protein